MLGVLLYMCLSLSTSAYGRDARVIGGTPSDATEFPFMVSLRVLGQPRHKCAGVIITKYHILSCAHCIYGQEIFYPYIRAHVGVDSMSDTSGDQYSIESVDLHPDFTGNLTGKNNGHNDIAVYTVYGTIEFKSKVQKIELPSHDIKAGSRVILSGWGLTSYPSDEIPNKIQKIEVKIMEAKKCQDRFAFTIHKDTICTPTNKKGVCTGDSGGPLTRHGKVVGIVSISSPCATGTPDLHTNVYTHLKFVKSIIKKKKKTPKV